MTTDRFLELMVLYVDGDMDESAGAELDEFLAKDLTHQQRFNEQIELMTDLILTGAPESTAPEGGLDRLMGAVDQKEVVLHPPQSTTAGFTYLTEKQSTWVDLPSPGLRVRTLSDHPDDPFTILVLEIDLGAIYPRHHHKGVESGYILSGDLEMDGRIFRAGDFMRAEPGSDHPDFSSPSGCQALLVMARENYPRKRLKAFTVFDRLFRRR